MRPRPHCLFPLALRLPFSTLLIEIRFFRRPAHAVYDFPHAPGQSQVLYVFNQVANPLHYVASYV
jgi:hypothetical protein